MKILGLLLALALVLLPALALADGGDPRPVAGFAAAKAIATGFTSTAIDMRTDGGTYTRLSVPLTVVWGTSTTFEIRILSGDTSAAVSFVRARCTSATVHDCTPRRYKFDAANWSGINPTLDVVGIDQRYVKIQLVAGAGTGTVLATATRAP